MNKIIICAFMLLASLQSNSQTWTANKKYIAPAKDTTQAPRAEFQCWGTTKKGERCKRKVKENHTFCYQHKEQAQ